jgi:hypothetical protein
MAHLATGVTSVGQTHVDRVPEGGLCLTSRTTPAGSAATGNVLKEDSIGVGPSRAAQVEPKGTLLHSQTRNQTGSERADTMTHLATGVTSVGQTHVDRVPEGGLCLTSRTTPAGSATTGNVLKEDSI